jgi:hypothetical protein
MGDVIMLEAESTKFKLSLTNEGKPNPRGDFSNINYEKLCRWIGSMEITDEVKKECLLILKKYPHSALRGFVKNFQNVHLQNARNNVKKNRENEIVEIGENTKVFEEEKFNENHKAHEDEEKLPDIPKTEEQTDFFPQS